jgi:hypothetical protein
MTLIWERRLRITESTSSRTSRCAKQRGFHSADLCSGRIRRWRMLTLRYSSQELSVRRNDESSENEHINNKSKRPHTSCWEAYYCSSGWKDLFRKFVFILKEEWWNKTRHTRKLNPNSKGRPNSIQLNSGLEKVLWLKCGYLVNAWKSCRKEHIPKGSMITSLRSRCQCKRAEIPAPMLGYLKAWVSGILERERRKESSNAHVDISISELCWWQHTHKPP